MMKSAGREEAEGEAEVAVEAEVAAGDALLPEHW